MLGELRRPDGAVQVACLGVRSRGDDGLELAGAELRRSIAVAFSDGGLLALSAARPDGAGDHGAEEIVAALVGPEGEAVPIEEALLSTQYDADGRHRRATLELWPEGEAQPPLRAGGAIVCGTTVPLGELRLDLAFFRWSMDGRP